MSGGLSDTASKEVNMETNIIEKSDLDPKLARLEENKISSRTYDQFEIYPGLTQVEAIKECWPEIEAIATVIGDSAYRCLSDMRDFKRPIGVWGDSSFARKQRNLSSTLDTKFLAKIAQVTDFYTKSEQRRPEYFWINKTSNGGFPHYTSSPKLKIENFMIGLNKVATGEKLPGEGNIVFRIQSDSVTRGSDNRIAPKKRKWTYTYQNAVDIKNLYGIDLFSLPGVEEHEGYLFGENINDVRDPFLQAARIRMAIGVDGQTNAIFQVLAQTIFDPHGVSEPLYILRSPSELFQWVKGKYITCIDFENFDRTVTGDMIEKIFEIASFNIPELSHVFETMYDSYINMRVIGIDALETTEKKLRYVFSEMKSDKYGIFGIISGSGLTHVIGKIIGTAFTAWALEEVGYKCETLEQYENLMKNCGDDNIIRHDTKEMCEKFNSFIKEQDQLAAGLEDPKKYLGNEIWTREENAFAVSASPSSFLDNSLCPERESGTTHRKLAVYGLQQRWELFRQNPPNDEIKNLIEKFFFKLRDSIPDYDKVLEEEIELASSNQEIQRILDKYGLTKPEEIFYKLQTKDLPREDLEVFGLVIPYSEVASVIPQLDNISILK